MYALVANGCAQMREVDLDFSGRPAERRDKVLDCPRVHASAHVPVEPLAQDLHALVSWPRVDGYSKDLLVYVYKARLLVPFLELVCDAQRAAEAHGCRVFILGPLEQRVVWGHGAVVAVDFGVDFLRFHPATGVQVVVALLYDFAEVVEDAEGHARVDVVVGLRAAPPFRAGDVVHEEIDIVTELGVLVRILALVWSEMRALHFRLDGRQINAFNLRYC